MKKKTKIIIGSAVALLVLGVGSVGYSIVKSNEYKADLDTFKSEVSKENTGVNSLQNKIESAYLKTNKQYLNPSFTKDDFTSLEKSVTSLLNDNKKLNTLLSNLKDSDKKAFNSTLSRNTTRLKEVSNNFNALKEKFNKQTELNKLFVKGVLVGDKLTEQPIADKLSKTEFSKVKTALFIKNAKGLFDKSVNDGLSFAEKQLKQIDDTKSKEAELVKDGKATDKANKDSLSQFKSLVDGIKNANIKKTFDNALKVVTDKVNADEKAKEEKAKQEAEAKAKEVGGNVEKQADGTYVVKASDGTEYKATGNGQVTATRPQQNATNNGSTSNGGGSSNISNGGTSQSSTPQPSTPAPQPSQPSVQPSQPSTPTPQPSQPATPTIVSGYIGNTGMLFNSYAEANAYGDSESLKSITSGGNLGRWVVIGIYYSDGSKKYSVDLLPWG